MFIPRKVAEAKPLGISTAQAEDLATKVRAKFLVPQADGDVVKLLRTMGGRSTTISPLDCQKNQDDLLLALDQDNFTVATVDYGHFMDGEPNRRSDIARAIGHMFIHYPGHRSTHGSEIAMVIPRYPVADDEQGQRLFREAAWFSRELLAPATAVAAIANRNAKSSEVTIGILVSREFRVSPMVSRLQVRRAATLGLINRDLVGAA